MRFTPPRLAVAAALLLNVATLIALIALYKPMYPLPRGNSNNFWVEAARVDLRGSGGWGIAACIDGDRAYYVPASLDAVWVHWLPLYEVLADYPAVLAQLKKDAADPTNIKDDAVGYRRWTSNDPTAATGMQGLINNIQDATTQRVLAADPPTPSWMAYQISEHQELAQQIARAQYYPANLVFEFLFLSGIAWFLLWPAIRRSSACRMYLHLATTPFLFLLPSWFGYCAICVTGPGPAGGILYPYLIWFLNRMWSANNYSWEISFLRALPPLLESINQSSWNLREVLNFPFLAKSGIYIVGPYGASVYSLILCAAALLLRLARDLYRRHDLRRPGFEILPALTPSNTTAESAPPAPPPHSPTPSTPPE